MSETEDEGIEPIPTESFLGGLDGDDEGVVIIDTEWEQRDAGDGSEDKRG